MTEIKEYEVKVSEGDIGGEDIPLPLHVIPNYMGINLNSVESVKWAKTDDGGLVSLSIHFKV